MSGPGPLHGLRVIELASEQAAFAGKLMGDLGADVILVEPPGGHASRRYGPFVDDEPDPERSLWWWHYNTSKRGIVLDLDDAEGRDAFRRLVRSADVVLEGEPPGRLAGLAVDHPDLGGGQPALIWVSVTPFGRSTSRAHEPSTDLTILAGGGPVWNCGYDDHTDPPVRGGGNQGFHIGSVWAVMGALTAVVHRQATGVGQHVDVSLHAAANVTTEVGTFEWLVAGHTVQRQTGRHASVQPTSDTQVLAADGRYVLLGFPPRAGKDYQAILDWMDDLGIRDDFPEAALLDLAVERGGVQIVELGQDPIADEVWNAGRAAMAFIASRTDAYEFFEGSQQRGIVSGIVYAPEEVVADRHFLARRFPVELHHDDIGRAATYPGAPFVMPESPWHLSRRAPHVGEHTDEVIGR